MIPPSEFYDSMAPKKEIAKNRMLRYVFKQSSSKINIGAHSAYDLCYDKFTNMKYSEYELLAKKAEEPFKNKTLKQLEDAFWLNMAKRNKREDNNPAFVPKYAPDQENISLFPDSCVHWNLNKFSAAESIIHSVCYLNPILSLFCFWTFSPIQIFFLFFLI